jgi:hypothetical protein
MSAAHVTIKLDADLLAQLVAELELSNPPSFTLNHSGQLSGVRIGGETKVRGSYHHATNHVTVTSQGSSYEREGLYVLTKHVRFTVLHELRHAWQREHWTKEQQIAGSQGDYAHRHEEIDANQWADYAMPAYRGLVTIKRTQVGKSGFSSLDRVARKG